MPVSLTEEEVKSLTQSINRRLGLDFTNYEIKSLGRGLTRLMLKNKMETVLDLWSRVLTDDQFFIKNIDVLMVNLTELFRNPDAWKCLQEEVFKQFANKPAISIWHAGCSTGEEVYTTAIVLGKIGLLYKSKAVATDLSTSAIEKATKGEFSNNVIGNYEKGLQKIYPTDKIADYFHLHKDKASIKTMYRRYATFKVHNLVKEPVEGSFDIIFCRNVMIYFDDRLKLNVLDKFYHSLNEGGFLIIGYYDVMPDAIYNYFEIYNSSTRVYRKIKGMPKSNFGNSNKPG